MKSVLISIKPKWCDLIASGKKTIEVRKNRPKIETPFKCYIYCCKPKQVLRYVERYEDGGTAFVKTPDGSHWFCSAVYSGKVIGEFVCDDIDFVWDCRSYINWKYNLKDSGLSKEEINNYAKGKDGRLKNIYCWHISELKIYDKPKELSKFGLSRPPQSWCYVG